MHAKLCAQASTDAHALPSHCPLPIRHQRQRQEQSYPNTCVQFGTVGASETKRLESQRDTKSDGRLPAYDLHISVSLCSWTFLWILSVDVDTPFPGFLN